MECFPMQNVSLVSLESHKNSGNIHQVAPEPHYNAVSKPVPGNEMFVSQVGLHFALIFFHADSAALATMQASSIPHCTAPAGLCQSEGWFPCTRSRMIPSLAQEFSKNFSFSSQEDFIESQIFTLFCSLP